MDLSEFYDEMFEDTSKQEIQIARLGNESQLVLAKNLQKRIIEFEEQKKAIENAEKILKQNLEQVMRANNITSYETNDKRIRISLGEDTTIETIDKDKLFMEFPDAYRECLKETPRKGTLRITVRSEENDI